MIQVSAPTAPNPGATAEEWQAFDAACRVTDLQIRILALLQQDEAKAHRDRMAAATEANAAALRGVADKTDSLADQKRAAVIQLLSTQVRGNRKPATFVADVQAQVDAVFAVLSASGV
jgi:hypothetical protein